MDPVDVAAIGVASALATAVLALKDAVEYLATSPEPAHRVALAVFVLAVVTTCVGVILTLRSRPAKPVASGGSALPAVFEGVDDLPKPTAVEQPAPPPPTAEELSLEKALATAVLRAVESLTAEPEIELDSGEQEFEVLGKRMKGRLTIRLRKPEEAPARREEVEPPL